MAGRNRHHQPDRLASHARMLRWTNDDLNPVPRFDRHSAVDSTTHPKAAVGRLICRRIILTLGNREEAATKYYAN